jgi:hypothetical protein
LKRLLEHWKRREPFRKHIDACPAESATVVTPAIFTARKPLFRGMVLLTASILITAKAVESVPRNVLVG